MERFNPEARKTEDFVTNIFKFIKPDINPEEYESKRISVKEIPPH